MAYDEEFQEALPRSDKMNGADLRIVEVGAGGEVMITDGERNAVYKPMDGQLLESESLRIFPAYVEAGYFSEANCVTLIDIEGRKAVYVPVRITE
jgi:hypothetical protein